MDFHEFNRTVANEVNQKTLDYIANAEISEENKKIMLEFAENQLKNENDYAPKIRTTSLMLSYELAEGKNREELYPLCIAIHVLDMFTYVHDDIIDKSDFRKGKETVVKKYGFEKALLIGNLFRDLAQEAIFKYKGENYVKIENCFNQISITINNGQTLDLKLDQDTTFGSYIERTYQITGVFFEKIFEIGALAANEKEEPMKELAQIGREYGIGVQIRNDNEDFFPPEVNFHSGACKGKTNARSNKDSHSDLMEGKYTLPIIYAINLCEEQEKRKIRDAFGNKEITPEEQDEITRILVKSGALKESVAEVSRYSKNALQILETFSDSESKHIAKGMIQCLNNGYAKLYHLKKKYKTL